MASSNSPVPSLTDSGGGGVVPNIESSKQDSDLPQMPSIEDMYYTLQNFGVADYSIFVLMLLSCGCIGIYFGFIKSSRGEDEYLVGGRTMKTFPVSMSLIASFLSGISLLGTPTEIYVHGTSYLCIGFGVVFVGFFVSKIFLPVFHELKITSTYEYLEKRFDNKIRILGSVLFVIGIMIWLPIVIYVPALAFNQVTGVNLHFVTPVVCIICIFYTCVGGLRAVVWTDSIQIFLMFGAMLLMAIKGTTAIGGFDVVIRRNLDSGRIQMPSTDWSPLTRHTIWSLVIGGCFHWMAITAINQTMIQRYLSLPSVKYARRALWIFIVGVLSMIGICGYVGMVAYAWYHECDPLTTKLAKAKDQLVPLLMMNVLGDIPGLPGLFVAGIFSAALSSLSTGLNSMSAVVLEDFVKPFCKTPFSPKTVDILMKLTVIITGVLCAGLVFVVERSSLHVLQLTLTMDAVTSGPSLGIFAMGLLVPWINANGAFIGGLSGLSFMAWISLYSASGHHRIDEKPVSTEGCTYSFQESKNLLMLMAPPDTLLNDSEQSEPWAVYRLSYLWYTVIGGLVTVSVGLLVSLISSENLDKLDPALVAPFVRKYLRQQKNSAFLQEVEVAKSVKPTDGTSENERTEEIKETSSL